MWDCRMGGLTRVRAGLGASGGQCCAVRQSRRRRRLRLARIHLQGLEQGLAASGTSRCRVIAKAIREPHGCGHQQNARSENLNV